MEVVLGQDAAVEDWLETHHGLVALQRPRLLLAIVDNGAVVGTFVLTWRAPTTAELHVYGRISHETVRRMFQIAFIEAGIHRLEIRCPVRDRKIRRAANKFGWEFEGRAHDYYGPGESAYMWAMRAKECRWLRDIHGLAV